MRTPTHPAREGPATEQSGGGSPAGRPGADRSRTIEEIAPETGPAPAGGYIELSLDDDTHGGADRAQRQGPGPAPAPAARPRSSAASPQEGAARTSARARHGVRAREVAMLFAVLVALGAAVAAFAPRAAPPASPGVPPAPPISHAPVAGEAAPPPARASVRRPRSRVARKTPEASPPARADATAPPDGTAAADAAVPLDTGLPDSRLAAPAAPALPLDREW